MKKYTAILLTMLFLGSCYYVFKKEPQIPEIAKIETKNFKQGKEIFKNRVKEKFPIGSSASKMQEELEQQGFTITKNHLDYNIASFEKSGFPCKIVWRVTWKEQNDQITEINPIYGGICL